MIQTGNSGARILTQTQITELVASMGSEDKSPEMFRVMATVGQNERS